MNDSDLKDKIINFEIDKIEGGFVNNPSDRGGPTKYGITLKTYANFYDRNPDDVSVDEIKNMPKSVAVEIYEHVFWSPMRIDSMPAELRHIAFDMSVNHGQFNAVKLLQGALIALSYRVRTDGGIGPATIEALHDAVIKFGATEMLHAVVEARKAFYDQIVERDPSQQKFYDGWINRDDWFLEHSLIDNT